VTANLGIDLPAMIAYVHAEQPTYPNFEAWIVEHGSKLDAASIAHHNAGAGEAAGEKPAAELARMGYPQFAAYEMFTYNDLGDWDAVHAQISRRLATRLA
jgi:hypothetical protein